MQEDTCPPVKDRQRHSNLLQTLVIIWLLLWHNVDRFKYVFKEAPITKSALVCSKFLTGLIPMFTTNMHHEECFVG